MLWRRGQAHGQELRERVFAAFDGGSGVNAIAERLFVSPSYVSKVLSRRRLSGETTARAQRCHVAPKLEAYRAHLDERVAAVPDVTLSELKEWLLAEHGVEASTTLIWETLNDLDVTFKKKSCTPPNRTAQMSPRHDEPCERRSRR